MTEGQHMTEQQCDLVLGNVSLAENLAKREMQSGRNLDDLRDTAAWALVQASLRYDPSKGEFAAYAATTIARQIRHEIRKGRRSAHLGIDPEDYRGSGSDPGVASERLRLAIRQLPERTRGVVERRLDGKSYAVIGREMAMSRSAAFQAMQAAPSMLQVIMGLREKSKPWSERGPAGRWKPRGSMGRI